jgi:hypothetical protein
LPYEVRKARADKKTARRQKREDRRAEKRGLKNEIAKHS